jgi:transposase
MSLSKLFHILFETKIAIFKYAEEASDAIVFYARIHKYHKRCACCNSGQVRVKDSKERMFRGCNLSGKKNYIKLKTYKFHCLSCGKVRWLKLPFTLGKLPMTKTFINYVISLAGLSTLQDVARFCNLQWKTIKNIDKANLQKRPKQFSFKKLKYLSIDEIAIRKGHKYMTIISNVETGQIIFAVKGRKEDALRGFLKRLAQRAKKLRGIAIDMSAGYAKLIRQYLS